MKREATKIIEIKKEVLNIIEKKKEKLILNNIEIEIITNTELNYFTIFWKNKYVAQIIIGNPDFSPYRFICFEIIEIDSEEIIYYWYDNEYSTIQEIIENINNSIDYFITYDEIPNAHNIEVKGRK